MSSIQVVWLLNSQVHLTPSVYGRDKNVGPTVDPSELLGPPGSSLL